MNDSETNDNASKIGNLLLVSERINSNMKDDNYTKKIIRLKKSKLAIVQDFVKYYGEKEEWREDMIIERTKKMAELSYNKVWRLC